MSLDLNQLIDIDISKGVKADLLIATALHEERAWHLANVQRQHITKRWFVFDGEDESTVEKVKVLANEHDPEACTFDLSTLCTQLRTWLEEFQCGPPTVLLDVSCMPRPAMASVMEEICAAAEKFPVNLIVGYVIATFVPPPTELPPNEDIRPISERFSGWPSNASATTSLIVGLGYEQEKAEGACEYFDASETWVFVPNSPITLYDEAVKNNNKALLDRVDQCYRSIKYPVNGPAHTFGQLVSIVMTLLPHSNPVILPFGPKIFSALSLLVAALYREVGVWHVTGDTSPAVINQSASDCVIGFNALLGPSKVVESL